MEAQTQTKYHCAQCGVQAVIIDGEIIRPCPHVSAGVTASMSAVAHGVSHFNRDESESEVK